MPAVHIEFPRRLISAMRRTLVVFLLSGLSFVPLLAQFRAGIQGIVTDPSAAVVHGATVTLTSNETQKSQKTQTSGEGFYSFSQLPPGNYTITAEKTGFQRESLSNVQINAEQIQGLNLTLTTGEISQTVTITGDTGAALQTENADVSKSITIQESQ